MAKRLKAANGFEIIDNDEVLESLPKSNQKHPAANVTQCLKIKHEHLKQFEPLTENQSKFFDIYKRGGYFIGMFGSSGSGKSFLAVYKAIDEVLRKDNPFNRLVIVRSLVQTRDIGYLPGDIEEKQEIFELPYKQICQTLFGRSDAYQRLKEQRAIEFLSTTAIRGVTLEDCIVFADEIQNFNFQEINTLMGRIGNRSKIILCGDFKQTDLVKSSKDVSAFHDFRRIALEIEDYEEVYFTPDDIVRSSLVKNWIVACEKLGY